jgi:hypothetical protein
MSAGFRKASLAPRESEPPTSGEVGEPGFRKASLAPRESEPPTSGEVGEPGFRKASLAPRESEPPAANEENGLPSLPFSGEEKHRSKPP